MSLTITIAITTTRITAARERDRLGVADAYCPEHHTESELHACMHACMYVYM